MKPLEELKAEVRKDFKELADAKVVKYLTQFEERIRSALLNVYNINSELSINANLARVTHIDVTYTMEELQDERPDIQSRVIRELGAKGYDIERTETNVRTLVLPGAPVVDLTNKVLTSVVPKDKTRVVYNLIFNS